MIWKNFVQNLFRLNPKFTVYNVNLSRLRPEKYESIHSCKQRTTLDEAVGCYYGPSRIHSANPF